MPRHTEIKIDELCEHAKAAKTEREVKRVLGRLRAALSEHIGLAKQSLEAQVSALNTLEAKNKQLEAKVKRTRPRKPRSGGSKDDPQSGSSSQTANAA